MFRYSIFRYSSFYPGISTTFWTWFSIRYTKSGHRPSLRGGFVIDSTQIWSIPALTIRSTVRRVTPRMPIGSNIRRLLRGKRIKLLLSTQCASKKARLELGGGRLRRIFIHICVRKVFLSLSALSLFSLSFPVDH